PCGRASLASGGALFLIVVDVEDQVVGSVVADLEVETRELFEFAQQVGRFVEPHREGGAALGEAVDLDLRGADLPDRVLEADQLREVAERADLERDLTLVEP